MRHKQAMVKHKTKMEDPVAQQMARLQAGVQSLQAQLVTRPTATKTSQATTLSVWCVKVMTVTQMEHTQIALCALSAKCGIVRLTLITQTLMINVLRRNIMTEHY
jgi:hypothetical protein